MELFLSGSSYRYECENLCRLFFPYSPVKVEAWDQPGPPSPGEGPWAWAVIEGGPGAYSYQVTVSDGERALTRQAGAPALEEYSMTDLLYNAFVELTGNHPAWGCSQASTRSSCCASTWRSGGRRRAWPTSRATATSRPPRRSWPTGSCGPRALPWRLCGENDFSLYVSIPFCPTRCAYCSFVSQDMEHAKKLMDPYFQLLLEEIEKVAQVTKDLGLSLVSVYIGGGTPTTLSARQLSALCGKIRQVFDFSRCGEFTVEAGRPDTITQEKLLALREAGISRISINPQSLSDQVLRNIGRRHTAQDVVEAFRLAQRLGFSNINADLIVGLPGDDLTSFQRTLDGVIQLGASNVTVHSLAIKRSARLNSPGGDLSAHSNAQEAAAMVDYSIQRLTQEGFEPYYLYRQTRMAGNLENTGWAKPGSICRYNIYTMDESNTVIACGAGGVSKVKDPYSGRLERIFNFKLPLEYINRFPEILQRKDGVTALYEQFRQRLR